MNTGEGGMKVLIPFGWWYKMTQTHSENILVITQQESKSYLIPSSSNSPPGNINQENNKNYRKKPMTEVIY